MFQSESVGTCFLMVSTRSWFWGHLIEQHLSAHGQVGVCQKNWSVFGFGFYVPLSVLRNVRWFCDYFVCLELTFPSAVRILKDLTVDPNSWAASGKEKGKYLQRSWLILKQRARKALESRVPDQIWWKLWYLVPEKRTSVQNVYIQFQRRHIQNFFSKEGKKYQILKLIFRRFAWFKSKTEKV